MPVVLVNEYCGFFGNDPFCSYIGVNHKIKALLGAVLYDIARLKSTRDGKYCKGMLFKRGWARDVPTLSETTINPFAR